MKKRNYVVLHIALALVLICLGVAIELQKTAKTPGIACMLMAVPGAVILFGLVMELLPVGKLSKVALILTYLAVSLVMDIVSYSIFPVKFTLLGIVMMVVKTVLEITINVTFHTIYTVANKKPRIKF